MGTITKALDLLGHFSVVRAEIGLTEFVRLSGRDKATVHRHLSELERNGFLEQHPVSRAYRLGPALLRLASVREAAFPMRALIAPIVRDLAEETGELAHASVLQGEVLSPLVHADPHLHGTQVHFDPAEMLPLHATASGLAVLAFGPAALRQSVLTGALAAHTSKTVTDADQLRALVAAAQATGLAKVAGMFDAEVSSQAVPLFGESGRVIGALALAVPLSRAQPRILAAQASKLRRAARRASLSLGAEPGDLPQPIAPMQETPA